MGGEFRKTEGWRSYKESLERERDGGGGRREGRKERSEKGRDYRQEATDLYILTCQTAL